MSRVVLELKTDVFIPRNTPPTHSNSAEGQQALGADTEMETAEAEA